MNQATLDAEEYRNVGKQKEGRKEGDTLEKEIDR